MKVSYLSTIDDLVSFNMRAKQSKRSRNGKVLITIFVPIMLVLYLVYEYLYFDQGISFFSIGICAFCVLWIIFYPKLLDKLYKKRLASMMKSVNFEPITVEISEDGVTKLSASSTYKFEWNLIENIITTKDHIFIYLKTNTGLAIPLRAFPSDEERDLFIKYIYDHHTI